jgi:hypothetical protein
MTYDESNALMSDAAFKGRVKVAVLKYAGSIMIEASNVPAHNTRERWAVNTMINPDGTAAQIQPPTVMDPAIQAAGCDATDDEVQGAVETAVNKLL